MAQHFFTRRLTVEIIGESRYMPLIVLWKSGSIQAFVEMDESLERQMKPTYSPPRFCKTTRCPSSETLLSYRRRGLPSKDRATVETHLGHCEFCSAELQLLKRHRNELEEYRAVEMPTQLRRLAEDLLSKTARRISLISELSDRHQLSH